MIEKKWDSSYIGDQSYRVVIVTGVKFEPSNKISRIAENWNN